MTRVWLVALREFRQITATRGFWVILLMIPLIIAGSQVAGRLMRPSPAVAYMIHDPAGRHAAAIDRRFELDYQGRVLRGLSGYAQRWKVGGPDVWGSGRRWFADREVEAFVAGGGLPAALAALAPRLPEDAPPFRPPPRTMLRADVPAGVPTDRGAEAFGAALAPLIKDGIATPGRPRPLAMAIYVPRDLAATRAPVRVWTNGAAPPEGIDVVRSEIAAALRAQAIVDSGVPAVTFARIEAIEAPLVVTPPPPGQGRDQLRVRSLLPLALVYLLLVTVMTTGAMMLNGVIEERSNKLLESVLACIRPSELMYGKLAGLGAVGLTIVIFWGACGAGAAFAVDGAVADFLRPSLAALDQPWIPVALLFYFLAGYLAVSMIYLAIGTVSDSMQDAQAYLMPVIMVIMLPIVFMIGAVLQDPNATLARVLSWIPLYTPFAMLARLGSGVSIGELLGTGVLLVLFLAVELYLLGRLFQLTLLQTGQPPAFALGRWLRRARVR